MEQDLVRKEFDDVSGRYGDAVSEAIPIAGASSSYFIKVKAEYLLDEIRKSGNPADMKALDLGCGVGSFHPYLKDKFATLTGVDISEQSLAQARQNNSFVDYIAYDGENLDMADDSQDVVFASCVLHHVPLEKRAIFMSNAFRILKPGGLMLIFEHNTRNPLTRKTIKACPFDDDAIMLPPSELSALFKTAGFHQSKTTYILNLPTFGRVTRKLDGVIGVLGMGAQYYVKAIR